MHGWNWIYRLLTGIWNVFAGAAHRLVKAGFAVYGMDYEGHGKSSGLQGFFTNFNDLVTDCTDHYTSICGMFFLSLSFFESISM